MAERSAQEVQQIEAERAQQLARKREEQVERRQGLVLKRNRQIAEQVREEKLKEREYQVKLREIKDEMIAVIWREKTQARLEGEAKVREFHRLEEVRDRVNVERDKRRAAEELKQMIAIRKHVEEEKEATLKRREKKRKDYLLDSKVMASKRAQLAREQARRNERRDQKIQDKEDARLRRFRESQFMDTMRTTRSMKQDNAQEPDILDVENQRMVATAQSSMSKTSAEEEAKQKTFEAAERQKRQTEREEKQKREEAKKGKMQQLSGRNPNQVELGRIHEWRVSEAARKKALEDARLNKELAMEKKLKDMHEMASTRDERTARLEVVRNEREMERERNRHQAVNDHIKGMAVGGGLPNVLVY